MHELAKRPSPGLNGLVLGLGTLFGIVMTKAEVVRWQRVHDMFLFKEPHMYLIICTAITVAMVSLAVLKLCKLRTFSGKPIQYVPKPFQKGIIWGGLCFGAGWAITGACPGPIYAQLGGMEYIAWVTFVGALAGMYLYAWLKPVLPH